MKRITYFSPAAHRPGHDELFASMAKELKWHNNELNVIHLPAEEENLTNVECRSCETMFTPGIIPDVRAK